MLMVRVAKFRAPSAASGRPAEILFPIRGATFEKFAQFLPRRDDVGGVS